jgi:hypothetical protein
LRRATLNVYERCHEAIHLFHRCCRRTEFVSTGFAQDFEQGWAALQAGDYETVPWLAAIRSRDNFLVQVTGFQAERRASRRRPTAAG